MIFRMITFFFGMSSIKFSMLSWVSGGLSGPARSSWVSLSRAVFDLGSIL
jgi:hypothetical protein